MGPASQFGWAGVNDAYLNKFVNSAGLALYGTTQIWLGSNGNTLQNFVNDTPTNTGINAAIAASGDLLILSYGINDVRIGGASQTSIVANLKSAVNAIRAALPNSDVILRMPNSLLSTDVNSHNWVVPNSSAQTYTDILRDAYRGLVNEWPNVVVYDSQALLFTEISQPSSIYMTDQLHPNADGYLKVFDQLAEIAGVAAPTCP
jgi:lysophospholipase L1-like esterase